MTFFYSIFFTICLVIGSWYLTRRVIVYTLEKAILDIPNERSSHAIATPRGGGAAFVMLFLITLCLLRYLSLLGLNEFLALSGGGAIIAIVGWVDDRKGLSPGLRFSCHLIAAIWGVFWLGGLPSLSLGSYIIQLSWAGSILAVLGVIWFTNLYNFMDGIDGLAAGEAVTAAAFGGCILLLGGDSLGILCLLLAACVIGFLAWNWPPARIFMGDVGSGFLGYTFAVLAIMSEKVLSLPLIVWLLLLGVFITDATITLLKRLALGEKVYTAHRKHLYQLAVRAGYSHKQVTLAVLIVNTILGVAALAAHQYPRYLLLVVSGMLMILILLHFLLAHRFGLILAVDGEKERMLITKSVAIVSEQEAAAASETECHNI